MPREVINENGDRVVYDTPDTYVSYTSPVARVVWFILGVVNTLLALRFILRLLGANPAAGFTDFIYNVTRPLVDPFVGVIQATTVDTGVIEWSTILAAIVYYLVAWAIVRLFTFARPATRY